jgi:acetyl-CoA carboxylase biotin carboxyl carrier protein
MDLTYDDVLNILRIIDQSSCEELHLELGDFKLIVRKRAAGGGADVRASAASSAGSAEDEVVVPVAGGGAREVVAEAPAAAGTAPQSGSRGASAKGVEVKAPMVGTFYRAPAPGAPPFVEVGSLVSDDDTVCIIEVMKLMNSIKAGCRGRVAEICAENGALVEFGQTLMVIEPDLKGEPSQLRGGAR